MFDISNSVFVLHEFYRIMEPLIKKVELKNDTVNLLHMTFQKLINHFP